MLSQLTTYVPVLDGNKLAHLVSANVCTSDSTRLRSYIATGTVEPTVFAAPAALALNATAAEINNINETTYQRETNL